MFYVLVHFSESCLLSEYKYFRCRLHLMVFKILPNCLHKYMRLTIVECLRHENKLNTTVEYISVSMFVHQKLLN